MAIAVPNMHPVRRFKKCMPQFMKKKKKGGGRKKKKNKGQNF